MKLTLNVVAALVLGVLAMFFSKYLDLAANSAFLIYSKISQTIDYILLDGPISKAFVYLFSILIITAVFYLPPALLYRLIKKKPLPYKNHYLWGIWLIVNLFVCLPLYLLGSSS